MSHFANDKHIDNLIDAREEMTIEHHSHQVKGQCTVVGCEVTVRNLGGYFCEEHYFKAYEDFRKELYANI